MDKTYISTIVMHPSRKQSFDHISEATTDELRLEDTIEKISLRKSNFLKTSIRFFIDEPFKFIDSVSRVFTKLPFKIDRLTHINNSNNKPLSMTA